ncbi:MAG: 1,4-alpha-glucan branching protein GlgB [Candidatus Caldarchaeum sp.]|nr:1,4-alpha-glucan branching protein GlgB [Candidatus Caldarchaeum sp.]MDW8434842.1 1,4-alpha-glucan branching protein GlgB [Candidatus Caldarchaeum sp.]
MIGETRQFSLFTDYDIWLFKQGRHFRLYEKMGAHPLSLNGNEGCYFAVWAPHAARVSVMGDFNDWNPDAHVLYPRGDGSGIWEGFVADVRKGVRYKYHVVSQSGYRADKGDPYALLWETPPGTASIVWKLDYSWNDHQWMEDRARRNYLSEPVSVYEVHIGSWRHFENMTFASIGRQLAEYVSGLGFTHVELLPVMEHPFYGSWGYQTTGYFAPTSRYGVPQDFMDFVDIMHQNGIGVILDWVPSHFPTDIHGLVYFDGTHLYEYGDPLMRYHPDWNSYVFDYGKPEVVSYLVSSAFFWLDKYHVDGLRVDAVSSMLYRDYSRKEWSPNVYGGKENLEAIAFLRELNKAVHGSFPGVLMIAEESTAWPLVSRPTYVGGLGFGMKWNMGWMHDTLEYFSKDPVYRKYHHNLITFSFWYVFSENYVLPISHDEVVYGKRSLLNKMPGDWWQKFANLRLLLGYMYGFPGKKLLFMGCEFGQWNEWDHLRPLDWGLTEFETHRGVMRLVKDLNHVYRTEPALHRHDFEHMGLEIVDMSDVEQSVIAFIRKAGEDMVLVVCNFTPVLRYPYLVGVPRPGFWKEIINTDAREYGGSGAGNLGGKHALPKPWHGRPYSLELVLPPLAALYLKHQPTKSDEKKDSTLS